MSTKKNKVEANNQSTRKTNKSSNADRDLISTSSRRTWVFHTCIKLFIAAVFVLGLSCIYLDAKVKTIFEGQRWHIPAQIYGHIEHLTVGDEIDLLGLVASLKLNGYKKVSQVASPGEFAQSTKRLIIYRRAFDFPNTQEEDVAEKVTIEIDKKEIIALQVNNIDVDNYQLDPILLARLVPDNKEDRVFLALEDMPTQLIDTLLLVEDRNFYHHKGIAPLGIMRALYSNIKAGHTVQGGSTLTQQLVKNMFLTRERSIIRKIKEALMALLIELHYSKDQLLEAYINEVYLGQHYSNGIYGFGLAAQFYFGKPVAQLNYAQMALLVGQVKGPSFYDPWKHADRAKDRRDLILRLMFEENYLSVEEFKQAVSSPLNIRKQRRFKSQKYPAYLQLVKHELQKHLTPKQQKSGIRVFTGFSHYRQNMLEKTASQRLAILEKQHKQTGLQAAMIVTDISSAEVRALVADKHSGYAGFNRALYVNRPIGSLIKPIIYWAALERYEQYNFATVLDDKPITLKSDQGKVWHPKNYDGKYHGQVPLIDALVKSLNIPTVNLGMHLGLDNIAQAIKVLGFKQSLVTRPSMLLGAINMSPWQINQLYLPFANEGRTQTIHAVNTVVDNEGVVLWQFNQSPRQVISTKIAYLMNYALTQVTERGTARSLVWRLSEHEIAGKTGTSNDLRDSWFIGYDAKYLVTTWLGKDNNDPTSLTGSSGALVLFADFMKKQVVNNKISVIPDGVSSVFFETKTGNAVTEKCDNTVTYPAVVEGIHLQQTCLKEKEEHRSWFEKLFGG